MKTPAEMLASKNLENEADAAEFIAEVLRAADHIRDAGEGKLMFSIEDGRSRLGKRAVTIVVEAESGDFIGVKTAGYDRLKNIKKYPELWARSANNASTAGAAPTNVTSVPTSENGSLAGGASNQNPGVSKRKGSASLPKEQISGEKSSSQSAEERKAAEESAEEERAAAEAAERAEQAKAESVPVQPQTETSRRIAEAVTESQKDGATEAAPKATPAVDNSGAFAALPDATLQSMVRSNERELAKLPADSPKREALQRIVDTAKAELAERQSETKRKYSISDTTPNTDIEDFFECLDAIISGDQEAERKYKNRFFRIAETSGLMKQIGMKGDFFTIRFGVLKRHSSKDISHSLGKSEWIEIINTINSPIAVTKYNDGYRIWTKAKVNGSNIVVGIDVKSNGRDMYVNSIATAFGADKASLNPADLVYPSDVTKINPADLSVPIRHNSITYPSQQEMRKGNTFSSTEQESNEKSLKVKEVSQAIADFARQLGRKVTYEGDFDGPHERGYVEDGVIHINPEMNAAEQAAFVLGHEFAHTLEGSEEYDALVDYIKGSELMKEFLHKRTEQLRKQGSWKLKRDMTLEDLVAYTRRLYKSNGHELTSEGATQEIVADFVSDVVLSDQKRLGEFIKEAPGARNILQRILDAIVKALRKVRNGELEMLRDKLQGAIDASMEFTREDGTRMFNLTTIDKTTAAADKYMRSQKVPKDERERVIAELRRFAEMAHELDQAKDENGNWKFPLFNAWNVKSIEVDENGVAHVTCVVKNAEYTMNIDFSTICKKRKNLDALLNALAADDEFSIEGLQPEDIAEMNKIIKAHGLEIACGLCFVDAKRYNIASWARTFAEPYNDMLKALTGKSEKQLGELDFAEEAERQGKRARYKENWAAVDELGKRDARYQTKKNKKPTGKPNDLFTNVKALLEGRLRVTASKDNSSGFKISIVDEVDAALAEKARHFLNAKDLLSSQGFDGLKETFPELYAISFTHQGTAKPKTSHTEVPYNGEIVAMTQFKPDAAYNVGGVRNQSFSDFVAHMVFDYVQMYGDLAAKGLPLQAYTKEMAYARLFGQTGAKINMSALHTVDAETKRVIDEKYPKETDADGKVQPIPNAVRESDPYLRRVGLDAEGNYVRNDESVNIDEAIALQNTPGYDGNIGIIVVGLSYDHILKLMADPNARMIIPYHASGINSNVAAVVDARYYTDYTDYQNTCDSNGKKVEKDYCDFNRRMMELEANHKPGTEGWNRIPQMAAEEYVRECESKGHRPRFPQFAYVITDGTATVRYENGKPVNVELGKDGKPVVREQYYKLLEDFSVYNSRGEYCPQGAVKMNFAGEMRVGDELPNSERHGERVSLKEYITEMLTDEQQNRDRLDKELAPIKDEVKKAVLDSKKRRRRKYSIMGERGASGLDAAEEATTRMDNLAVARQMETEGKEPLAIKQATGWERGGDGKWRYEVPDGKLKEGAFLNPKYGEWKGKVDELYGTNEKPGLLGLLNKRLPGNYQASMHAISEMLDGDEYRRAMTLMKELYVNTYFRPEGVYNYGKPEKLSDVWEDKNLYRAYPELASLPIVFADTGVSDGAFRAYPSRHIAVNIDRIEQGGRDVRSVMVHEIQHAIQHIEGFATGSNISAAGSTEAYHKMAGEVEARNVQSRLDMSEDERREKLLSETEDVARKDQVFLRENLGESAYIGKKARARYEALLEKKRPEMTEEERKAALDYLHSLEDTKENNRKVKIAMHWLSSSDEVNLPNDMHVIDRAIASADRKGKDAMAYRTPQELLRELGEVKEKQKRIDPDTVPTLTRAYEVPGLGIVVYDVYDDTKNYPGDGSHTLEESRRALREIINTHWGEAANPWCLLQGDGKGNLTEESEGYWRRYDSVPKQVAFQNGKLLAFRGADTDVDYDKMVGDYLSMTYGLYVTCEDGRVDVEVPELGESDVMNAAVQMGIIGYDEYESWMNDEEGMPEYGAVYNEVMAGLNEEAERKYREARESYDTYTDEAESWWDRSDRPHVGVPYEEKDEDGWISGVEVNPESGEELETRSEKKWRGTPNGPGLYEERDRSSRRLEYRDEKGDLHGVKIEERNDTRTEDVYDHGELQEMRYYIGDRLTERYVYEGGELAEEYHYFEDGYHRMRRYGNGRLEEQNGTDGRTMTYHTFNPQTCKYAETIKVEERADGQAGVVEAGKVKLGYDREAGTRSYEVPGKAVTVGPNGRLTGKAINGYGHAERELSEEESREAVAQAKEAIAEAAEKVPEEVRSQVEKALGEGGDVRLREGENLTDEELSIVEKAKADGTYMKAPNGEPTKLSEKQWAQVRTEAFKEWFGDWELAAQIIQIVKGDLKFKNDAEIISYMKEHFMEEDADGNRKWKTFINLHSGNTLTIGIKGITKSLSAKAKEQSVSEDAQRTALSKIDEIIANSVLGETHEDREGDPNIVEMQRYYGAITIDGVTYRVKTTAKRVKVKGGTVQNSYYTLEVQDMELIEVRPARQAIGGYGVANDPTNLMNSISGAKLLNKVKNSKGEPILNSFRLAQIIK